MFRPHKAAFVLKIILVRLNYLGMFHQIRICILWLIETVVKAFLFFKYFEGYIIAPLVSSFLLCFLELFRCFLKLKSVLYLSLRVHANELLRGLWYLLFLHHKNVQELPWRHLKDFNIKKKDLLRIALLLLYKLVAKVFPLRFVSWPSV